VIAREGSWQFQLEIHRKPQTIMGPNQEPTAQFRQRGPQTSQWSSQGQGGGAPPSDLNSITTNLRQAAGLDPGSGSVTDAVQAMRRAAGLPIGNGGVGPTSFGGSGGMGPASSGMQNMGPDRIPQFSQQIRDQIMPGVGGGSGGSGVNGPAGWQGGQDFVRGFQERNGINKPGGGAGPFAGIQKPGNGGMSPNQQNAAQNGSGSRAFYSPFNSPYGGMREQGGGYDRINGGAQGFGNRGYGIQK
jgi:hypothetical protein